MLLGMVLLAFYAAARIQGSLLSQVAVQTFEASQGRPSASPNGVSSPLRVDFSLWSQPRIATYKQMLAQQFQPPLALLRIGKIGLQAPVLDGTDDLTLNRGTGWITGSARPGEPGNVGIAGHRDSFFRGLKDLRIGDTMDLVTQNKQQTFVVEDVRVVSPDDVSVLRPRATPSLTLVTCYPFYFVGSAPQRYIVQASLVQSLPISSAVKKMESSKIFSQ